MEHNMPSVCPVCAGSLEITKLSCPNCHTEITGRFQPCRYCALNDKMQLFLEAFLKSGGNIKEVERALSLSYPTVKSLLAELLKTLYGEETKTEACRHSRGEILDMLENKVISVDEAAALLAGKIVNLDSIEKRSEKNE
jgi:hypothetical protein